MKRIFYSGKTFFMMNIKVVQGEHGKIICPPRYHINGRVIVFYVAIQIIG